MHMFFTGAGLMLRSFFIGLECDLTRFRYTYVYTPTLCGFDPRCRQ